MLISVARAIPLAGRGRMKRIFGCVVPRISREYITIFLVLVDDRCYAFVSTMCKAVRSFVLRAAACWSFIEGHSLL